jgi:saccharopine dehydrogenase (NADP+, L-glutamate forming)
VAGPLVRYFLGRPETTVVVADIEVGKARALVSGHPNGKALALNLGDENRLDGEIGAADVVVSLAPNTFHPIVARHCLARRKNLVTTSYVSDAMTALDEDAREAGLVFLNEVGLDPGIDHMEAMRVIDGIKAEGGRILGFTSWCGGLPAPEANTNPFGYKFSWSPRGVLLAGKSPAHYRKEGRDVLVPAEDLFEHISIVPVAGLGDFEGYPNRNSVPYAELYGITEAPTMFRGTLRYPGWCETMKKIGEIGLLDAAERNLQGMTYVRFVRSLLGMPADWNLKKTLRDKLKIRPDSKVVDRLEWLGLFAEEPISLERGSALDVLESLMLKRLRYAANERDMIILRHEFLTADRTGRPSKLVSTLIDYGVPGGDSSMARTVGYPAAVGTRLILEGRINRKGVLIPVYPEIYGPILDELDRLGVVFKEERQDL